MNLERHAGHAVPRVFVAHEDPMFVAVCAPHREPGPWGEPEPFRSRTKTDLQAEVIVAAARARNPAERAGGGTVSGADWPADMRSRLAAAALGRVAERLRHLRIDIELAGDGKRLRAALPAYVRSDDVWLGADTEQRVVVSTCSLDVVGALTGLELARELALHVTVAVRSDDFAAALYFEWDEDRFYVAESGEAVVQAAVEAAQQHGFDAGVADDGIWVMDGLRDYFEKLKVWARDPRGELPF